MVAWSLPYLLNPAALLPYFSNPTALIALIVKLAAVTMLSTVASRRIPDRLSVWLHTWLAVQIAQTVLIMILSLFGALSKHAIWSYLLSLFGLGVVGDFTRRIRFKWPAPSTVLIAVVLAIPLILWAIRCMLLFDFSLDAQTYGSVRIGLWMNYRSVFVHMPTLMVNIFASEWNGELNALVYALSTNTLQGALMGNAEILVVATLASMWASRQFGAGQFGSAMAGLLMATSPAFLGLAAVTKGDLLSCVGVIMAIGMIQRRTVLSLSVAAVWFALAAGAKISVLPGAAIVMVVMVTWKLRTRRAAAFMALSLVPAAILLARYIANFFMFGHPFARVSTEAPDPGINTLLMNISIIGERSVGFFFFPPNSGVLLSSSLTAGLGVAGWLSVVGLLSGRLTLTGRQMAVVLLSIVSIIAAAYVIPARVWGFRYFLPFVSILAIVGLVALADALLCLPLPARVLACLVVASAAAFDFYMCFTPGDLNAPDRFEYALDRAITYEPLDRMMQNFPGIAAEVAPLKLDLDSKTPKTIGIFNEINRPIVIFEGASAQNRLYLADSYRGLADVAERRHPDLLVIAKRYPTDRCPFEIPGYRWIAEGATYDIAIRNPV
ncbi:hypothetical protein [Paraburkholderia saeva]|uniref:Uncharacterized protein n=1 Tax=Paraburkholderia saeva TaxID=2777537 RepID=A0A9N8X2E2_9BURK|nr:hypothetical protein [Paraburkholderia saeva]CAG4900924.1 hypothetical protein LMG31841_02933 [Paraburkholderia saeva]